MIGAGSIGVHSAVISGLVDFQRVERKNNRLIPACRDSWRTISSCSLFSWSADGRQDGDIEIAVGTEWTVQREDESTNCFLRCPIAGECRRRGANNGTHISVIPFAFIVFKLE